MTEATKIFQSSTFREAHEAAKREQTGFRSMLETYRSPRSIAAAAKKAAEEAVDQAGRSANAS